MKPLPKPTPGYTPYRFLTNSGKLAYQLHVKALGNCRADYLKECLADLENWYAEYAKQNDRIRPYTYKTTGDFFDYSDENAEVINGRYAALNDLLRADKRAAALARAEVEDETQTETAR